MAEFILSPQERNDPLWLRLSAHYNARLNTLRVQNDTTKPHEATEKLRGQIQEVNLLLALGFERKRLPDE